MAFLIKGSNKKLKMNTSTVASVWLMVSAILFLSTGSAIIFFLISLPIENNNMKMTSPQVSFVNNTDALANSFRSYSQFLRDSASQFEAVWRKNSSEQDDNAKLSDFEDIKTFAAGSYGQVKLVRHKPTQQYHAMKILQKKKIRMRNKWQHVMTEKKILQSIHFPFIVNLNYHFQDDKNLYLIMEYVPGGDLNSLIWKNERLNESHAKFYAAQLVLTLEYLHNLKLMHRDLKPENVLIDADGYLKITDFGSCQRLDTGLTWDSEGTRSFNAPEILLNKGYNHSVDWWSLGVLIYEMVAGHMLFTETSSSIKYDEEPTVLMYGTTFIGNITWPSFFSGELKDFLLHLLQPDPSQRLGSSSSTEEVKRHSWLESIDWLAIYHKQVVPPMKPSVKGGEGDTSHFLSPVVTDTADDDDDDAI